MILLQMLQGTLYDHIQLLLLLTNKKYLWKGASKNLRIEILQFVSFGRQLIAAMFQPIYPDKQFSFNF